MLNTEELLKDLTEPQRQAVTHVDGPLLIIAGAGSGKTRVITRRVAYLMSLGIPGNSILAITFTNKAAGEMKARVAAILGRELRDFGKLEQPWPTICTFHSLCLRILRHYGGIIGLARTFSVYDAGDQSKLIKQAMKDLQIASGEFTPAKVHGTISNAKNRLISAEDYAAQAGGFYERTVEKVYRKYEKLLTQNNALDFDDLQLRTAQAFRGHPKVLADLQQRFQYVLIDEYQDTNHAQYMIAHGLVLRHRNMCVVGDPDQSIYAWRGADIGNILDFEKDYPDAKVVRLEQNYRSTKTILHIASQVIAHNRRRKEKKLWTENAQGERAQVFLCEDEHDEAKTIARRLLDLHEQQKYDWNDMAIFYRVNALSRVMEDALRRMNIPYQIARGVEFYNRKEIKDVLGYLRVIANPQDEVSLSRIANVPARGLSDKTIRQLQTHALGGAVSLLEAMAAPEQLQALTPRAVNSARNFVTLMNSWREMVYGAGSNSAAPDKGRVQSIMEDVVRRSGLEAYYKKIGEKEQSEISNIEELINSASEYDRDNPQGSLEHYLGIVSLVSDVDRLKDSGGAVTLMTLHAAKGLEFPVVSIIGLEEGILPHSRAWGSDDELEEERRLCFVGITRAQERLLLSHAASRMIRGIEGGTSVSKFLREMPEESLELIDHSAGGFDLAATSPPDHQDEQTQHPGGTFRRGQMVRHRTFGIGCIAAMSTIGQHTRVVVEFDRAGRKTLILQYAKLEPVG